MRVGCSEARTKEKCFLFIDFERISMENVLNGLFRRLFVAREPFGVANPSPVDTQRSTKLGVRNVNPQA